MGSFSAGGVRGSTAVQAAALLLAARLAAEVEAAVALPASPAPPQLLCMPLPPPRLASYDPAATSEDGAVLRILGVDVLADDAGGAHAARRCTCGAATAGAAPLLAFMPHCDAHLYDALLRANADDLPRVCLLGNSLALYHLAGNVARRDGSGGGGKAAAACPDLVRWSALAAREGDEAAAAPGASFILVETSLPLGDCDAAVERALNATSLHTFAPVAGML